MKNLKSPEFHIFVIKRYFLEVIVISVKVKMKKYLKKKDQLRY